jgi:hypothetical protein
MEIGGALGPGVHSARPGRLWLHYLRLAATSFGVMFDVALFVLGTALVGLAMAVLLDGLDLVELGLGLSTGGSLGSALVLAVGGAFAFGVGAEGPGGRGTHLNDYTLLENTAGLLAGSVLVGLGLLFAGGRLQPLVADLPTPFESAVRLLSSAGWAGLVAVPLLGIPALWGLSRTLEESGRAQQAQMPLLYVVWAIGTAFAFTR